MLIMNGHRTISEAQFLDLEDIVAVYREGDSFPDKIVKSIYEYEKGDYLLGDVITPLNNGKEWLFDLTCKYQPRTGKLLMEGGPLCVRQRATGFNKEGCALNLGIEVNGKMIIIRRGTWNSNPSDPDYTSFDDDRIHSIPFKLREAYYTRFDGLNIYPRQTLGIHSYMLPQHAISLCMIDHHFERFKNKKKRLKWFDKHFPHLQPRGNVKLRTRFCEILNTIPFYDTYEGEEQPDIPLDFLFIKTDPRDGVVYHMVDDKIDEMRILDDPVDVMDRYCEHVLLNKTERFDFLPFTSPLTF